VSAIDFSLNATAANTQTLTQARGAQALNNLQSQSKDGDLAKIDKAAKDFESILLGEWLEKAEKSFASVPGADPDKDQDAGHDQFQSMGCQFLGEALSKAGGIGIASMISKHLKAIQANHGDEHAPDQAHPTPGKSVATPK
jgi:Rod binding domain-containing protein